MKVIMLWYQDVFFHEAQTGRERYLREMKPYFNMNCEALQELYQLEDNGEFTVQLQNGEDVNADTERMSRALDLMLHDLKDPFSSFTQKIFLPYRKAVMPEMKVEEAWIQFAFHAAEKLVEKRDPHRLANLNARIDLPDLKWYFSFYLPEQELAEKLDGDPFIRIKTSWAEGCPKEIPILVEEIPMLMMGAENYVEYAMPSLYLDLARIAAKKALDLRLFDLDLYLLETH